MGELKFNFPTEKPTKVERSQVLEVTQEEIGLESISCAAERNREHYQGVCRKLSRYNSENFRNKPFGQQPPRYRIFNLLREALRLNDCIYGSEVGSEGSLHADLIVSLRDLVSYGSTETSKDLALKMAVDICKFVCEEIN